MDVFRTMREAVEETGWNEHSQLAVALEFIQDRLPATGDAAFEHYVAGRVADERMVPCTLCEKSILEIEAKMVPRGDGKPEPYCDECEKLREPGDEPALNCELNPVDDDDSPATTSRMDDDDSPVDDDDQRC